MRILLHMVLIAGLYSGILWYLKHACCSSWFTHRFNNSYKSKSNNDLLTRFVSYYRSIVFFQHWQFYQFSLCALTSPRHASHRDGTQLNSVQSYKDTYWFPRWCESKRTNAWQNKTEEYWFISTWQGKRSVWDRYCMWSWAAHTTGWVPCSDGV